MNKERKRKIIKTSIIGITINILLSSFKAIIGLLSSSIAIIIDSVNNLTDALSSIITIIGVKLAWKAPDKEHPFGHGRIEYISALTISILIIYAGFTSLIEGIKRMINPKLPDYNKYTIIILIIATITKILLGIYFKKIGKKVKSEALLNSGTDALMDAIISTSTLIGCIAYILFKISLEAYLAIIISVIIIKSGITMFKKTLSQILGERPDKEITKAIKNTVEKNKKVYGAYDLTLNNYGPNIYIGSIHIEIEEDMTAKEIDKLTRKISNKVYKEHNVILTAIGIYSINTKDKETNNIREEIQKILSSYHSVLQSHGFYIDKKERIINFDIILDFENINRDDIYKEIYSKVQSKYPNYEIKITMDIDI